MNSGNVKGGSAAGAANAGNGLAGTRGSNITNSGLIEGGDSATGEGGRGVSLASPGGGGSLTNYGIVRGGQTSGTSSTAAYGVFMQAVGGGLLINAGTIEGGSNSAGIVVAAVNQPIINSGHILGGLINGSASGERADAIRTSNAGVLVLDLQAGSTIEGNVVGSATLNDTLRLSGTDNSSFDVSSIGATAQYRNFENFEKTGSSTWTLTGEGTTATPWHILEGTLQLGDGGTSGSIIGDVLNDSVLVFNRSDALAYEGVISGAGSVLQIGSGTTTLTGAGSVASTLDVQHGTLEVASGAGFAASTISVAAGATLRNAGTLSGTLDANTLTVGGSLIGNVGLLDGDDQVLIADGADVSEAAIDGGAGLDTMDLTHSRALTISDAFASNFEQLTKRGAGTLTFTGTVDGFRDSITLAEGSADLSDATINTSDLRVQTGVRLMGNGLISGNLVNAGVLSPGHSPGTIQVGGNYTQAASGTLISEITPNGTDLLHVAGSATLAGTHQIQVQYGLYLDGTTHTLLQADGGIIGDFDAVQINPSALMTAARQSTANAMTVRFARQPVTSLTGLDPNTGRGRFATWLEGELSDGNLTPEMTDYIDSLYQQGTAEGAVALLGERGEPTPVLVVSQGSIAILGAGFARTLFERLTLGDAAQCAPTQSTSNDTLNCFWLQGLHQWGSDSGDARYDWTTDGVQFGVDRELSSGWTLGATFAHSETNTTDFSDGRSDTRSNMGGLYANYAQGRWNVGTMAFYSSNDNETRRNVLVGGANQEANAQFDGDSYGGGVRVSYRLTSEKGPLVRPYVEAFVDRLASTGFSETGASDGNLSARIHSRDGIRGTLGLQLAGTFETEGRVFRPSLDVGIAHQFGDVRATLDLRPFSDATSSFRTYGPALERTTYLARASVNASVGPNASIALGYDGELADGYSQQQINLRFVTAW